MSSAWLSSLAKIRALGTFDLRTGEHLWSRDLDAEDGTFSEMDQVFVVSPKR